MSAYTVYYKLEITERSYILIWNCFFIFLFAPVLPNEVQMQIMYMRHIELPKTDRFQYTLADRGLVLASGINGAQKKIPDPPRCDPIVTSAISFWIAHWSSFKGIVPYGCDISVHPLWSVVHFLLFLTHLTPSRGISLLIINFFQPLK